MATIRRITPSNPVSGFSTYQPRTAGAFDVLATVAETAWERADPLAREDAKQMGKMAGYEAAGSSRLPGLPGASNYRDAIASIESAGSGDYAAIGPTNETLGRARGRYQIMEANIGPWSEEILGRTVTADEFLANPDIQDQIFDGKFGQYVALYGEAGAAQAWFAGPGGVGKLGRSDVLGTTVGGYTEKFMAALGGPTVAVADPQTGEMRGIREAAFSGPYKALYDNAAQIAYQAEVINRAGTDLAELALRHPLDPEGYAAAADRYVAQLVAEAPETMRPDIEAALTDDARRRVLGLQAAKMDDIRDRANNASAALVDRYSTAYAEAKAAGDETAAAAALTQLDSVLRARETLPGVGWTPEQSANAIMAAEREAMRVQESRASALSKEMEDNLKLAIDAAQAGRTSAFDALAGDPIAAAQFPELVRELQAYRQINDAFPDFAMMSQPQREAAVASLMAQPVSEDWQIDFAEALRKKNDATNEAWATRTIETAQDYAATKPPALVDMGTESPQDAITAMRRRRDYVNAVIGQKGLTENPLFLSEEEAASLKAVLDPGVEPGIRAMVATGIVQGFGPDAERVFRQLGIDDPVLKMGAMLSSRGVDATVMTQALQGQALMREKAVQVPSDAQVRASPSYSTMVTMLEQIPGASNTVSDVAAFATSIYASGALGIDPDSAAGQELLEKSFQRALGQNTDPTGKVRGGVAPIFGMETLLPPDVAATDLEMAVSRAAGTTATGGGFFSGMAALGGALMGESVQPTPDAWAAAGGVPHYLGQPLTTKMWQQERVQMIPLGNPKNPALYRMTVDGNPVTDATGRMLAVDVYKLMQATK